MADNSPKGRAGSTEVLQGTLVAAIPFASLCRHSGPFFASPKHACGYASVSCRLLHARFGRQPLPSAACSVIWHAAIELHDLTS
jgi:hypothetical protein